MKWYFKTSALIVGLLCVGPLALPLAWFNPRYSKLTKLIITVAVLAATYALVLLTRSSIKSLSDYYNQVLG